MSNLRTYKAICDTNIKPCPTLLNFITPGSYSWVQFHLGFYLFSVHQLQCSLGFYFLSSRLLGILFFEFKSVWDFIFQFKSVWNFMFEFKSVWDFIFGFKSVWEIIIELKSVWDFIFEGKLFLSLHPFGILLLSLNPFVFFYYFFWGLNFLSWIINFLSETSLKFSLPNSFLILNSNHLFHCLWTFSSDTGKLLRSVKSQECSHYTPQVGYTLVLSW